jgi:hypothetical protein
MLNLTRSSLQKKAKHPIEATESSGRIAFAEQSHHSMSSNPNVSFQYMYRDASNHKQYGEAVFTNQTFMPMEEIEKHILASLQDGEFFIARQVHIEERFFDALYEDDHPWHEHKCVETTTSPVFDPENWNEHHHKRDIAEFIADLEKAQRAGWDETQVRGDVDRLLERQKQELKRSFEAGEDILS